MRRSGVALLLAAFAFCCSKESNPVLPTDPTGPGASTQLTVGLTSDVNQLNAGSAAAAALHVTARYSGGTTPADGTQVTLNTNLGSFGNDAAGKPVQLTKAALTGGSATVQFFAGAQTGTANILAQIDTTVATLNLPIVTPPPVPVADFTFSVSGLSVLFTDASTGSPATRRWQFGDGKESSEINPAHGYAASGNYTVTLTVSNAAGETSKSKFVTVSVGLPPVAAFEFDVAGRQAHFVDSSTNNPTAWSWDFGDGSGSGDQNPVHLYGAAGKYTVTLKAVNLAGANSVGHVVTIAAGAPPVAVFDFTVTGNRVNFVDQSTGNPTGWLWDFGDHLQSSERNPIHSYASAGAYTVMLTASNSDGSSSASRVVTIAAPPPPVAAFAFQAAGLQVNFVDRSTNAPASWLWNFGDGSATSTQQNPIHTYAAAGNYTVSLTATNASGSSSTSQVVAVSAGTPPKAEFAFQPNGLTVNFADSSTGTPTSWGWNFGDGRLSSQQNPVHTYAAAGTYTVTLTVSNAAGSNSVSHIVQVTAPPPPSN
jgi:PKD repeat protein